MRERRIDAREPAEQPLAQHAGEALQRGQAPQEEGGHGRGAGPLDLAREALTVGRGERDGLLDEQRAAGLRGAEAQRRALVGRGADHDRVRTADRGVDVAHRGAAEHRRHRAGVLVPGGDEPEIGFGRDDAEHVRDVRMRAAEQGDVDGHASGADGRPRDLVPGLL